MKKVYFSRELVPSVLSGEKTATWRILPYSRSAEGEVGDMVELVNSDTDKVFATAKITEVIVKNLNELTEEDWKGQVEFANTQKMYEIFSKYYNRPIGPDNTVKIIRFELIGS